MNEPKVVDKRRDIGEAAEQERRAASAIASFEVTPKVAEGTISIKPMPNRILVREDDFEYKGRIHIPQGAQRRPTTGRVIAVGAEITKVAVGERILYPNFSGTGIHIEGQPVYRVLTEDEILVKLGDDIRLKEVTA